MMQAYLEAVRALPVGPRSGRVLTVAGSSIEAAGPDTTLGEICEVDLDTGASLKAEVVGMHPGRVVLMPYGELRGICVGSRVTATGQHAGVAVGPGLLGRVIDPSGAPLDGGRPCAGESMRPLTARPINPLTRPRIDTVLETGVRAIDTMLPLGRGQRVGIFAGSGVGKSTLLAMLARNVKADINVIALIGERGREVREFIEKHLGKEGLARSVVVVATSDQPSLARVRAAYCATTIAEFFRDQGSDVLLMMDSITRLAMARREIGLATGEPPTSRGYTPSVFAEIPALCERCGTADSGGSITAMYTVLVEGDDFNEPISDIVRATLDGHIMLTRELAHEGHFPAIDVLQSTSRLAPELAGAEDRALMAEVVELLATFHRNRQMVEMGAYKEGSNAKIDRALRLMPALDAVLRQGVQESTERTRSLELLRSAVTEVPQ